MENHTRDKELAILERLRRDPEAFVSGTEIAAEVGISRAAIGKRVQVLRERGWTIDAVQNRGYRLLAEADSLDPLLVEPQLRTRWLGRSYAFYDTLASTNDEASRLAADGAPHGTVVAADAQSAGRGRLGRRWHSPPGANVYLSAVLRPDIAPAQAPPIGLAAGVAVADALAQVVGRKPRVKWPNDILYGGSKIAGILVELSAELERVRHVIVGIGINVNLDASELPAELQPLATSVLRERGEPVPRAAVLTAVLAALERWTVTFLERGAGAVVQGWLGYADWLGQRISVTTANGVISGAAMGLDRGGALLLRDDAGRQHRLLAGDVALPPTDGP